MPMTSQCGPLRQTFVLTPAVKLEVDLSAKQPSTKFHLCNKFNKHICIKYISSHVTNYQHVSIAFVIIIEVALQEYKEYNNLPYRIMGTTQCYNKCLKHWVVVLQHTYNCDRYSIKDTEESYRNGWQLQMFYRNTW
jgi:hypothetical protein